MDVDYNDENYKVDMVFKFISYLEIQKDNMQQW